MSNTRWIRITKPGLKHRNNALAVGKVIQFPTRAAIALVNAGKAEFVSAGAEPARGPQPKPPADEKPSAPSTRNAVLAALRNRKKDDLVEGLKHAGLNPDDYVNNGEREAALRAWLEE